MREAFSIIRYEIGLDRSLICVSFYHIPNGDAHLAVCLTIEIRVGGGFLLDSGINTVLVTRTVAEETLLLCATSSERRTI